MALFGEKCVRCDRKRTKEVLDGVPTCEPCQQELLTNAQAGKEAKRVCMIDGSEMTKDVVANIIIDRCPECGGVWLDGGELELIRDAVGNGVAIDLARAMTFPG